MVLAAQELIQHIVAAFARRSLPPSISIFQSHSSEVDTTELERIARHAKWIDVGHDLISDNPLAIAFMTPEAFAWFLPAYLVLSVTLHSEIDSLTGTILTCLTPPDPTDADEFGALAADMAALGVDLDEDLPDNLGADERLRQVFSARTAVLTREEKVAVREYLEHLEAEHGAEFPAFGPQQALDRYWRAATAKS